MKAMSLIRPSVRRFWNGTPSCSKTLCSPKRAEGTKCARSWKVLPSVGSDPQYPDLSPRDAAAMREWDAVARDGNRAAE